MKRTELILMTVLLTVGVLVVDQEADAHGGGTNAEGCHTEKSQTFASGERFKKWITKYDKPFAVTLGDSVVFFVRDGNHTLEQ